jgi:hypothetical protein
MAINGINARVSTTSSQRRLSWLISGFAIRLLIAFVISWLIILAFFVSGVVSH